MVKALHAEGIGVILDVVLNHTAEGGTEGPTIGYKGLVNELFYLLDPLDRAKYLDFTGCGNTVSSQPAARRAMARRVPCDSGRVEMHVDGFRFDLAGVLSRDEQGKPLAHAPVIAAIELAPELGGHALDRRGVGRRRPLPSRRVPRLSLGRVERPLSRRRAAFLARRARSRWASSRRASRAAATCMRGRARPPQQRHQLRHVPRRLHAVRPRQLRREAQQRQRRAQPRRHATTTRAGTRGVEGADATTPEILRAARAASAQLHGVAAPLARACRCCSAGDEVLRTQRGNNNAYCQDNDVSWLDWSFAPAARTMLRFTRELIALRKRHPSLRRARFLNGHADNQPAEIHWYGETLAAPGWQDPDARVLCFTLAGVTPQEPALHVMINMAPTLRNLPLPDPAARNWRRIVDTTFDAPDDVVPAGLAVRGTHYFLAPHGIAVFEDSAFMLKSSA